jgi:putative tryptophan/tyrosine transport system substrate-binding protein
MIRRRNMIALLGGAAMLPVAARAQQPALPVIGFLNGASFEAYADRIAAFRQGLKETGYVEGRDVAIEYRTADGHDEPLPALAADLVRRQVAVIVAIGGDASPRAAIAATSTIPIVFATGGDALASGLVASLNRPAANVTGVSFNNSSLAPKRLGLMRDVLPEAVLIAFLEGISSGDAGSEADVRAVVSAARTLDRQFVVFDARTERDVDAAFAAMVQQRVAALVVSPDAFLNTQREKIVALASRHAIPTVYSNREYVRAGGLMSYGVELYEVYRLAGVYAGRILRGTKPGDLPVLQPTKFELVINLQTAKTLGLDIPPSVLAIADEVIE